VVSSTPRPHFTPGKDQVPILQVAGWAPGPIWTGGISRPRRDSIPDRPARSQFTYSVNGLKEDDDKDTKLPLEALELIGFSIRNGIPPTKEHSKIEVTCVQSYIRIFISVINQLDAQNFCFTISLFHASTCFEHMFSSSGGQNCITQPLVSSHLWV